MKNDPIGEENLPRSHNMKSKQVHVSERVRYENWAYLVKSAWPDCDIPHDILMDAARFSFAIGKDVMSPAIWCADGEVAFEWITSDKHAIVSFDGDGTFGYAMRVSDSFEPGAIESGSPDLFPDDLRRYLSG